MDANSSRNCTRNHLATQASTTGQIGQYLRAGRLKADKHSEEFRLVVCFQSLNRGTMSRNSARPENLTCFFVAGCFVERGQVFCMILKSSVFSMIAQMSSGCSLLVDLTHWYFACYYNPGHGVTKWISGHLMAWQEHAEWLRLPYDCVSGAKCRCSLASLWALTSHLYAGRTTK